MRAWHSIVLFILIVPLTSNAEGNRKLDLLPCGIYDQDVHPFIEKDLDTQSGDRSRSTMEMVTGNGRQLRVEVRSVEVRMSGERDQVSVFLDGKPFAKTSHQDVPLYLEVHIDNVKYRIICVRIEPSELPHPEMFSDGMHSNPAGTAPGAPGRVSQPGTKTGPLSPSGK